MAKFAFFDWKWRIWRKNAKQTRTFQDSTNNDSFWFVIFRVTYLLRWFPLRSHSLVIVKFVLRSALHLSSFSNYRNQSSLLLKDEPSTRLNPFQSFCALSSMLKPHRFNKLWPKPILVAIPNDLSFFPCYNRIITNHHGRGDTKVDMARGLCIVSALLSLFIRSTCPKHLNVLFSTLMRSSMGSYT